MRNGTQIVRVGADQRSYRLLHQAVTPQKIPAAPVIRSILFSANSHTSRAVHVLLAMDQPCRRIAVARLRLVVIPVKEVEYGSASRLTGGASTWPASPQTLNILELDGRPQPSF